MSLIGETIRKATAHERELVAVTPYNLIELQGRVSNELYWALYDPCTMILWQGLKAQRESLSVTARLELAARRKAKRELTNIDRTARSVAA